LRRRSAVEPVIGYAKGEHRMGRNYLARQQGDATNAVLAAAGYNFRRLLAWLALSLFGIAARHTANGYITESAHRRLSRVLHGRLGSVFLFQQTWAFLQLTKMSFDNSNYPLQRARS
jgi:hypothetical protein